MNSVPATNTESASAAWICGLLQAGDSYYPTGSYAHSYGLEGLVQEGVVRDRDTLREFVFVSVIPGLVHGDLALAAHGWRALGISDWAQIAELARLSSAIKAPRELRTASENIGRQRAELLANLRSAPLAIEYVRRAAEEGWPHSSALSAALEGRVFGAPLAGVLSGVFYANLASIVAAAMKILRVGQNAAQALLVEALATAPEHLAVAETIAIEDIGWFNPWLDIAASRHESADARLFIS